MIVRYIQKYCYYIIVLFVICISETDSAGKIKVLYGVNCGGDEHVDYNGIPYKKDPLEGKVGTASDFGKRLMIGRVPPQDQILYQTERYHDNNFGYHVPLRDDGDYVLVLKFSEVYFNAPEKKVFNVKLNNQHTILSNLDIFSKVGRGVAHDEYITLSVSKGQLYINSYEKSEIKSGMVYLEFIKGSRDNPKINAFCLIKGSLDDVPLLMPHEPDAHEEDFKEKIEDDSNRVRRPSGPALPDPYTVEDASMLLPVFIAIGAFIPVLFCLCKL